MTSRSPGRTPNRDQRRRFIRHHLPLAVASALALALFMAAPAFDPQAYPRADMSGPLPRPMEGGSAQGNASPAPPATHGSGQTPSADHGADPLPGHGPASGATPGHAPTQSPGTGHGSSAPSAIAGRLTTARLTVATGYVATGLLALTLVIGPANLVLRRRRPVSSYLRRDAGMWTAAFSVVHVIFGLQVHGGGELSGLVSYFLAPDGSPLLNSFGLGNWSGLAATVIVVGLLGISSDWALRTLKSGPWKWVQRSNYVLFALVVVHAIFYGALVRVDSPFTRLLLIGAVSVAVAQTTGIWLWRRRHRSAVPPVPG